MAKRIKKTVKLIGISVIKEKGDYPIKCDICKEDKDECTCGKFNMSLSEDVKLQIRLIKSLPYLGPDSPHMGDDGELSSCLGNISYNIKEARRIINRNKEYAQYYKEV